MAPLVFPSPLIIFFFVIVDHLQKEIHIHIYIHAFEPFFSLFYQPFFTLQIRVHICLLYIDFHILFLFLSCFFSHTFFFF
ncbi:hypothetical protein BDC45DRAFT_520653, partial [Circinella umbellata]